MSSNSSTQAEVRVRFAPSPTGLLHIGGLRSALFNWLWARHNHGQFILRLEDTDRTRLVPGAEDQIIRSLQALGLEPDEGPELGGEYGPYRQSDRLNMYREQAQKLLETGALYRCWCPPERLTSLREAAQRAGKAFVYDRHCLTAENQSDAREPHVLRFRIPEAPQSVVWDDAVRGRLSFETATLDDFVALKADGYPTYHFANVVDDHLMAISHVLRADEWIPSTPKHLLLFAAFGWEAPVYAHLPAVQGPTGGKKLSKRDGAQSIEEYVAEGYLPEALRSFLATLGWNDGTTQEVFTTTELIAKFNLDRVQKSPARFDKTRLTWVNGKFIRSLQPSELEPRCRGFWPAAADTSTADYRQSVLALIQDRLETLSDVAPLSLFFFEDPKLPTDAFDENSLPILKAAHATLSTTEFTLTELEQNLRQLCDQLQIKPGQLFSPIRLAVTGSKSSPGLFETLEVIGQASVLRRIKRILDTAQI